MTDMPPYLETKDEEKNSEQSDSETSDSDDWDVAKCYDQPRHLEPIKGDDREEHSWRVKEKYKTHCVALVLCLNVGVDPPDVVKTKPCARVECWIDPAPLSPSKALESIGHALQAQYERWQPRARYKHSLDPTSDEVKKLCCSLRRNAKDERVLFHYNGHGVPKPTAQGEIWVFNRTYTQYIPLSMYDLQTWMGAPSLYVYDCSHAGAILENFRQFAEQHEREQSQDGAPLVSYRNCIQLAACAAGQSLPMNPELPADLFTACLTTPVKMAMKWFALRNTTRVAPSNIHDLIDKIPGQVTDRRTMLGELNWIFTAVTDTIAWSSLPAELFTQLFRADLLTASLCRNFLLAERIMRAYNCTPVSSPALPSLAQHPLWAAWDHTLDLALAQLPALLSGQKEYTHSPFFRDQLTAFQVWLDLGSVDRGWPQQLPMVLQVLLSTLHRLRALRILVRFLALGTWAARAVLDVGIFPYMLKLLQASAPDLRPSMLHIWSRLVAVAPSCQVDLVNAKGHKYFLAILQDPTVDSEQKTLAAYVLAHIVDNYPPGQEAALQGGMVSLCLELACEGGGAARVWASLACARAWRNYSRARMTAARDLAHEKLCPLLQASSPDLRAAAAHALGALLTSGASAARADHDTALDHHVALHLAARLPVDASPLVRHELLAALQWIILIFEQHFIAVYIQERARSSDRENRRGRVDPGQDALATGGRSPRSSQTPPLALPAIGFGSVYTKLWASILQMAREPHPQTAQMAQDLINYVAQQVEAVGRDTENTIVPSTDQARSLPGHGRTRTKSSLPHTLSEDSVSSRDRDQRDSTSSTSSNTIKKPIVRTYLAEWACARFVRGDDSHNHREDCESRQQHELAWRRRRNRQADMQAAALARGRPPKLESQAYHSRCALPPTALQFHPYEQQVAVATRDNFGVWDWGCAARLCVGAWSRGWGRLTNLCHLPAELIAAAGQNGNVAIFKCRWSGGGGEGGGGGGAGGGGGLLAAWRALHVTPAPDPRPPPAMPIYSLTKLMTDQFTTDDTSKQPESALSQPPLESSQCSSVIIRWVSKTRHLAVCGRAPSIRLWDCQTEMLAHEINTESESGVTALSASSLLTAGFCSGGVASWDARCLSPAHRLSPSRSPVLATCLRDNSLTTVAAAGEVTVHDVRKLSDSVHSVKCGGLLAADVHPVAGMVACGSTNQCILMYDSRLTLQNTIKFHEGFMGARIGPVSCLAFHPLIPALGAGGKDATLSVYTAARSQPER